MNKLKKIVLIILGTTALACLLGIIIIKSIFNESHYIKVAQYEFDKDKPISFTKQSLNNIFELSNFLIENSTEIVNYNQHEEHIFWKREDSSFRFQKHGDCFSFSLTDDRFLKTYFPPELIKSLYEIKSNLDTTKIESGFLCKDNNYNSKDKSQGSVFFHLKLDSIYPWNNTIVRRHKIGLNTRHEFQNLKLKNVGGSLEKNYELDFSLQYYIEVTPNFGW